MANLNIRVDDDLKRQAERVFGDLGLTTTTAMTMFLKQVVRYNGIPFQLRADPFYSQENQAVLRQSVSQLESGGGTIHDLIEVEDG